MQDNKAKPTKSNRLLLFWLFYAVVLIWAVFVRCWSVGDRPLWMDEAAVANLITNNSIPQLLTQTDLPTAPLFTVTVKLISSIFPAQPETSLRLLPMICGIAVVPLIYLVLRTLRIPPVTSLLAMTLCASSPLLVIWSRELKQYQIEAFFSILLAYLVFKIRRSTTITTQRTLAVSIIAICLFGPWFGYGLIFPAVTLLGILILLKPLNSNRLVAVLTGSIGFLALAGSVLILLKITAAGQANNSALKSFMGMWFINPISFHSWTRAAGYGASTIVMMFLPFYQFFYLSKLVTCFVASIFGFGALLGLLFWPKTSRIEMVCWTIIPWFLLLAAAVAKQYPFGATRMMCFAATSFVPAFTMGLILFLREFARLICGSTKPAYVVALIVVFAPVFYMVHVPLSQKYWVAHDVRGIINTLEKQRQPDEPVMVSVFTCAPVKFYTKGHDQNFIYAPCASGTRPAPDCDYADFTKEFLRNTKNQWWFLTMGKSDQPTTLLLDEARKLGYRIESVVEDSDTFGKTLLIAATKR